MPVSFLDLVPALPTATVTINTATGPAEVEVTGVPLRVLAEIGRRFASFQQFIEGGEGSLMQHPESMAALIAAALGHPGDEQFEHKFTGFPAPDVLALFQAALRVTLPPQDQPVPLAPPRPAAVAGDGLDRTSPSSLNN